MRRASLICLIILINSSLLFPASLKETVVQRQDVSDFIGYVPDEIVVKLSDELKAFVNWNTLLRGITGIPSLDSLGQIYQIRKIEQEFPGAQKKILNGREFDLSRWFKLKFNSQPDIQSVVNDYKSIAGVLDAQPIGIHSVSATPNDTHYARQWHLNRANDSDVDVPEAWDVERGNNNIIVAILDTGVRYFHKDLGGVNASIDHPENSRGNMWINTAELNGTNSVDDDGNSYTDDWIGWDFVDNVTVSIPYFPISGEDYDIADDDPRDFNGHGTHCAGIVGAINNNNYAVASTAGGWGNGTQQESGNGVKIMALRIGYSANHILYGEVGLIRMDFAAQALHYAADNGAKIASCSWGSSNSGGLGDAIDYFLNNGGLIFKAAGNDGVDDADYMGQRTDIINVAATDSNDIKADFSNYGTWVDISAPGTGIWSTYHLHSDSTNDYVASLDGTSMATPIAASVAALIWSHNPDSSADFIKQKLFNSADTIDTLSGNSAYVGKLGAGRVNAYNGVTSPVQTKIFLQGPYDTGTHQMTTTLQTSSLIPTTSPYSDARSVSSIPSNVVDWVQVLLRTTATGSTVALRSAFLRKDGLVVDDDGSKSKINIDAPEGNYYVLIKHRNHIQAMSASPVTLGSATTTLFDFTSGSGQFYGSGGAKELESGIWGMWVGDINQDGQITTSDYVSWYNAYKAGSSGYQSSDLNMDGNVTTDDYNLWNANATAGASTSVP